MIGVARLFGNTRATAAPGQRRAGVECPPNFGQLEAIIGSDEETGSETLICGLDPFVNSRG